MPPGLARKQTPKSLLLLWRGTPVEGISTVTLGREKLDFSVGTLTSIGSARSLQMGWPLGVGTLRAAMIGILCFMTPAGDCGRQGGVTVSR